MQLIRPSEVTGKILSLIEDAKSELIIVSPYNDFSKWDKLKRYLAEAKGRGIQISYYAREGEDQSCLKTVGIDPLLIKNLHAKLYLNEQYAILSSMNLVEASDKKSIDFALITTTKEQYQEVRRYFVDYIQSKVPGLSNPAANTVPNSEIPCYEFFSTNMNYGGKKLQAVAEYHKNTTFIKQCGHTSNGKKYGDWFYFNSDGLLEKVESNFSFYKKEKVNYREKVSRYYLLFTVANVISGLFNCSVKDFYFKSYLKDYIRDDPEKFFSHLKLIFGLGFLDYNAKYAEELVDEIHDGLFSKSQVSKF